MSRAIELECTPAFRYNGGLKQNSRCFLGPLNSPLYRWKLSFVSEVESSSLSFLSGGSPSTTCITLSLRLLISSGLPLGPPYESLVHTFRMTLAKYRPVDEANTMPRLSTRSSSATPLDLKGIVFLPPLFLSFVHSTCKNFLYSNYFSGHKSE